MERDDYLEIERKFLIHELPPDYKAFPSKRISQTYLSQVGSPPTIRVRQLGDLYLMTVKSPHEESYANNEVEFSIDKDHYHKISQMCPERTIEKRRYFIPWKGKTIELDLFEGKLDGLILAEIEYTSVVEVDEIELPPWFGEEVSQDYRYSNSTLSAEGIPPKDSFR